MTVRTITPRVNSVSRSTQIWISLVLMEQFFVHHLPINNIETRYLVDFPTILNGKRYTVVAIHYATTYRSLRAFSLKRRSYLSEYRGCGCISTYPVPISGKQIPVSRSPVIILHSNSYRIKALHLFSKNLSKNGISAIDCWDSLCFSGCCNNKERIYTFLKYTYIP